MPVADDFQQALVQVFYEAYRNHQDAVEGNAADLHRLVGGYPGHDHGMPICCSVMRSNMAPDAGDIVIAEPPSGQGASLTIPYVLPRREH